MEIVLRIEKAVGGALLLLLTATILIQVVFRFLIDLPLAWSEELSRYSFIWLTMIVAPICIRLKANIGTGTLAALHARTALIVELCGCVLTLVFAVVLLVWGAMLLDIVRFQRSPAMGIPMYWVYAAIPAGAALMIVEIVALLVAGLKSLAAADRTDSA
jgi:TRAP-type C4-dicarboxylate transport system permease small subunit